MGQLEDLQTKTDELTKRIAELEKIPNSLDQLGELIKNRVTAETLNEKVTTLETEIKSLKPTIDFSAINQLITAKIDELWYVVHFWENLKLLVLGVMILSSLAVFYVLKLDVKFFADPKNQIESGAGLALLAALFALLYLIFTLGTRNSLGDARSDLKKLKTLQSDIAASKETILTANEKFNKIINSNQ